MYKIELQEKPENSQSSQQSINNYYKNQVDENSILRQNQDLMTKKIKRTFLIICAIAIVAGTLTGFGAYKLKSKNNISSNQVQNVTTDPNQIKNGDVFGVQDKDTFADNVTGYIEKGGIDGEGSHKLLREGGSSQTVALTSSVVDLDKLVGMEVKLYGETNKAEKAGWFMDVGRVEVTNTKAEAPIQTLE